METKEYNVNGYKVIEVIPTNEELLITDTQSALDLAISIQYQFETNRIVIDKKAIVEDFFILKTKKAGEILQKYINYDIKMAIYGDFKKYTSHSLQDFIKESNKGHDFFFVETKQEAIDQLVKKLST